MSLSEVRRFQMKKPGAIYPNRERHFSRTTKEIAWEKVRPNYHDRYFSFRYMYSGTEDAVKTAIEIMGVNALPINGLPAYEQADRNIKDAVLIQGAELNLPTTPPRLEREGKNYKLVNKVKTQREKKQYKAITLDNSKPKTTRLFKPFI